MWVLWVNILFFRFHFVVWPEFVHFRLQYYIPRQEHIIMYLSTILWCTFFTPPQYEAKPNRAAINIKVHNLVANMQTILWQVEQRGHKVCTHSASILPTSLPKWLNQSHTPRVDENFLAHIPTNSLLLVFFSHFSIGLSFSHGSAATPLPLHWHSHPSPPRNNNSNRWYYQT